MSTVVVSKTAHETRAAAEAAARAQPPPAADANWTVVEAATSQQAALLASGTRLPPDVASRYGLDKPTDDPPPGAGP
jgi:hypothetical protein